MSFLTTYAAKDLKGGYYKDSNLSARAYIAGRGGIRIDFFLGPKKTVPDRCRPFQFFPQRTCPISLDFEITLIWQKDMTWSISIPDRTCKFIFLQTGFIELTANWTWKLGFPCFGFFEILIKTISKTLHMEFCFLFFPKPVTSHFVKHRHKN